MNQQKITGQERQRKVDALAADIFARRMASGQSMSFTRDKIAEESRADAEAFYPAEETPAPSVPMTKAV